MQPQLKRISAAQAVVNHFKDLIESGVLQPGDKLPSERDLQKALEISRFALREGLARLSALGIVRIVHGKGAFVSEELSRTSLTSVFLPLFSKNEAKTYEDLYEARLVIEREAAALAARRRSPANIERLRDLVDRMRSAAGDAQSFGGFDHAFHREIVTAAGNVFFEKMFDVIDENMRLFLLHHAKNAEARKQALRQHEVILSCIAGGKHDAVGDVMMRHIVGCKKAYERTIKRLARERTGQAR
jgi:DNA-binding FadR family transcriptional regulator